jgi:hypothetical protein
MDTFKVTCPKCGGTHTYEATPAPVGTLRKLYCPATDSEFKYLKDCPIPSTKRDEFIMPDDILNLKITLEATPTVEAFLAVC